MSIALYEQIITALREEILSGRFRPGDRIPTELELSGTHKVSRITATRAVRELENQGLIYRVKGRGSFVRAESEWRINRERSRFLSFVVPFERQAGSGYELLNGAEAQANKAQQILTIHNSDGSPQREKEIILDLLERRTEGLLFYPTSCFANQDILSRLLLDRIPLVVIDRPVVGVEASFVAPDNVGSIRSVVEYLAGLGHRRIAFLANTRRNLISEQERFVGYCRGMMSLRIPLLREYVRIEDELPEADRVNHWNDMEANVGAAQRALEGLMAMEAPPTAIITVNDLYAVVVEKAARRMGIGIPQQLSITGYDNLPFLEHLEIPLTTVAQPFRLMGETAIRVMQNLIRDPQAPVETHLLQADLVVRASTGAPSGLEAGR
jgi:GntR family transcriptional regulator, arabinose operon transcriptional repressor